MSRLLDRDLVSALVLFVIGGVFLSVSGTDARDWLFPRMLIYVILVLGVLLAGRVVLGPVIKRVPNLMRASPGGRNTVVDLLVFCAIALAYILLMHGLGFWLASFLMIAASAIYLTPQKTPRNLAVAGVVALVACVVAYGIFLHVFYVPLPEATWWSGVG